MICVCVHMCMYVWCVCACLYVCACACACVCVRLCWSGECVVSSLVPRLRHNLLCPETVAVLHVSPKMKCTRTGDTKSSSNTVGSTTVVTHPSKFRDKMESFFLGETLKYLFILLDL